MSPLSGPVLVVVCHYNARPAAGLIGLLDQLAAVPAGWPVRPRVVVNLGEPARLLLPRRHRAVEIVYRENAGYNLGAWECGWREPPSHEGYLFLQEDCRVVRPGWAAAFVRRACEGGVGLVGECLSPDWDAPWDELDRRTRGQVLPGHLLGGTAADRVPCYLDFFRRRGIDAGPRGDHLQALVLFARRDVLEAAGGFPESDGYGEAIAAEIGVSKRVQALGLAIREVGPEPFHYIEHPQWLHRRAGAATA